MTEYLVHSMGRSGTRAIWYALQRAGYSADFTHEIESSPKNSNDAYFVISPIREPVSRNMSAYFRNCCEDSPPSLSDFLQRYPHEIPLTFFDREIATHWGIDVYDTLFDKKKGWQVYEGENMRLLVIRMENFSQWNCAFKALTGEDAPILNHENKTVRMDCIQFRKSVTIPEEYRQQMYDSRYYKHFYKKDTA